jgi:hypothetical protein
MPAKLISNFGWEDRFIIPSNKETVESTSSIPESLKINYGA